MSNERNSSQLITTMFETLDKMEKGEITPSEARARAAVANTIVSVARLEMDYAARVPAAASLPQNTGPQPVLLGSSQ